MNKFNVTEIGDKQPVGWLIYRPDTEEYVICTKNDEYSSHTIYTKEPCLAYSYKSERAAFLASTYIDRILEIVPLFDIGDMLGVILECNQQA